MIRTYSELKRLPTFEDRFRYLKLNSIVADTTFGIERYLNQNFYRSEEWRSIRRDVILRDGGCDLGIRGYDIFGHVYIHHMNPIMTNDIIEQTEFLTNPEYLICVSHDTHNAIHYGDESIFLKYEIAERTRNDTCPWRKS